MFPVIILWHLSLLGVSHIIATPRSSHLFVQEEMTNVQTVEPIRATYVFKTALLRAAAPSTNAALKEGQYTQRNNVPVQAKKWHLIWIK